MPGFCLFFVFHLILINILQLIILSQLGHQYFPTLNLSDLVYGYDLEASQHTMKINNTKINPQTCSLDFSVPISPVET